MDSDNCDTPQKAHSLRQAISGNVLYKNKISPLSSNHSYGGINRKKTFHPRTPNSLTTSSMKSGLNSPPAKRFSKIRNPFEAILVERLHLPLIGSPIIGSPSLFQKPTTPQHSSTQFEWTIEEVSSLQPANVEAHETQFQDSPDPEIEAKAQSAISLYFKEQQIVPSPVDCPLRNQRIILSEINGSTPISKSSVRKVRDNSAQTVLSLPSILPKALEDALAPYLKYNENQQNLNSPYPINTIQRSDEYEARDVSLRRKLFDMHNIIVVDNDSDVRILQQTAANNTIHAGSIENDCTFSSLTEKRSKLSDSLDKDSFGSLSPISLSPSSGHLSVCSQSTSRRSKMCSFIEVGEMEELSPIQPPRPIARRHRKSSSKNNSNQICTPVVDRDNYRCAINSSENTFETLCSDLTTASNKFSPERSSSPVPCLSSTEMLVDSSFNVRVSRLVVNSSKRISTNKIDSCANNNPNENDISLFNETENVDDDVMQDSQTSLHSNISSSSSNTPQSKRRSASRKNLSHSFSAMCGDDTDDDVADVKDITSNKIILNDIGKVKMNVPLENMNEMPNEASSSERSVFYRTDSGFNEMTTTQDGTQFKGLQMTLDTDVDQIYIRCSTPSKQVS